MNRGNERETSVGTSVTAPGRNGGTLRRGGGNPLRTGGRTPNVIRDGLRKNLPATVRRMRNTVKEISALIDRRKALCVDDTEKLLDDQERLLRALKQLADFEARYGVGATLSAAESRESGAAGPVLLRVVYEDDENE